MRDIKRRRAIQIVLVALVVNLVLPPGFKTVHASLQWDSTSKRTLGETSSTGPAVAYHSSLGKVFMAWAGTDSPNHYLNIISSDDMYLWSGKVTTSLATTSGGITSTNMVDLTYDSGNQKLYLAYQEIALGVCIGASCSYSWNMLITSSSDGQVWSNPTSLTSGAATDRFWTGLSIAYNSAGGVLAAVASDFNGHSWIYQSSDHGVTWSVGSQIYYNGVAIQIDNTARIRYLNGIYFLSYTNGGNIYIIRSTDLVSWTGQSSPPQSAHSGGPEISYFPGERYHLNWRGTDVFDTINDAVSFDGITWQSPTLFEATSSHTSMSFHPYYNSLLLGWTGTDSHLNVMQYHVTCGATSCGGSVAEGSLITMADGSKVPVEQIRMGDRVIAYNVPTGYQTVATVYQIDKIIANSTLTIHTTAGGRPFRADANPHMRLWVYMTNGPIQKPITDIQSGDQIFNYDVQSWVTVTKVKTQYGGQHIMYDLWITPSVTPAGLVLEFIANGYPDCRPACKV